MAVSPLARRCDVCGSPNPANRHLHAAAAPILGVLRWAQRRRPGLPRVSATAIGAAVLVYPFSPLILSWWMIVALWWLFRLIGLWFLAGLVIGIAGFAVLESAGFDCSNGLACMADALGLYGGPVTSSGISGVVLAVVGMALAILAVVRKTDLE
jgi:hypothetical protein